MHAPSSLPHTCVPPFDTPQPFRNLPAQNTPEQRRESKEGNTLQLLTHEPAEVEYAEYYHHPRCRIVLTSHLGHRIATEQQSILNTPNADSDKRCNGPG